MAESVPRVAAAEQVAPGELRRVTPRAVVLGLALVIGFTVAGCFCVFIRYEIIGTGYLPRGALAALMGAALVNPLLRFISRRLMLRPHELLLTFCMLLAIGAIPGQEFAQHVYLNQLGLVYYATPGIADPQLYLEDLNPNLVADIDPDSPVITDAFDGLPGYRSVPYAAWLKPLAIWTPFYFAVYWIVLCFSSILSPHWEDNEKLLFPLTQVPVEMVKPSNGVLSSLLKSWLMWACFGVACFLYVMKGLHTYFPSVPDINLQSNIGPVFQEGPMRTFNYLPTHVYPEMIGIAYLLTSEVGFSMWFFYIFRLLQQFLREAVGYTEFHGDFFHYQTVGGYVVLAAAVLYTARQHLARVLRYVFFGESEQGWPARPQPYRLAVYGFILGELFIWWWCWRVGMDVVWAILLYLMFPLGSMIVARVICEAGMFIYSTPFRMDELLFWLAGTRRIGPQNVTLLSAVSWTQIRSTATLNMPAIFQSLKIGSDAQLHRPQLFWWMFVAVCVTILTCHVTSPYVIYTWGVRKLGWWPSRSSQNTVNKLVRYLTSPTEMHARDWTAMGLGAGLTVLLVIMRQRFLWWPFHPLGYVAWLGWPIHRYWMSFLIGWLAKTMVVRSFGYKGFRLLRPAAFGLILGICFILTFWIVVHLFVEGPPLVVE